MQQTSSLGAHEPPSVPPTSSTVAHRVSPSIIDIPHPSQWTTPWLEHFRTLTKLQYRDYMVSLHSELRSKMELPVDEASVSIAQLLEKSRDLCGCVLKNNPSVLMEIIDSNLVTGEKLKVEEEQAIYQKAACSTPLHLLSPGAIPQLKAALVLYGSKMEALGAEKVSLRSRLEAIGRPLQARRNTEDQDSVGFSSSHPSAIDEILDEVTQPHRVDLIDDLLSPPSRPSQRQGPFSAPSCSHPYSSSKEQQVPHDAFFSAALGDAPLRTAPLSSLEFRPRGDGGGGGGPLPLPLPLPLFSLSHFMTLEQILDRLEQIFHEETRLRAALTDLIPKISNHIAGASVLLASFPYVLDSVRILKVFLEELEKPDVLPVAKQTVPHIFND